MGLGRLRMPPVKSVSRRFADVVKRGFELASSGVVQTKRQRRGLCLPARFRDDESPLARDHRQRRARGRVRRRSASSPSEILASPCPPSSAISAAPPVPVPPAPPVAPAGALFPALPSPAPAAAAAAAALPARLLEEMRNAICEKIFAELERRMKRMRWARGDYTLMVNLGLCTPLMHTVLLGHLKPKKTGTRGRPRGRRFRYRFGSVAELESLLDASAGFFRCLRVIDGPQFTLSLVKEWVLEEMVGEDEVTFTYRVPLELIWHEKTNSLSLTSYVVLTYTDSGIVAHSLRRVRKTPEEILTRIVNL
jgi:hypothetical protein